MSFVVNRHTISEAVCRELGFSKADSSSMVNAIVNYIVDALVKDGKVKITSFGSFAVKHKNRRPGRNPRTGIVVPVEARFVVSFSPSAYLRRKI